MVRGDGEFTEFIPHEEFRAGLPAGRFRVVVNPKLARRYVSQRLMLVVLVLPLIGVGIALALAGRTWLGAGLVALGVVFHRVVLAQAPRILLQMAARDPAVYAFATQNGLMEVRRAGS